MRVMIVGGASGLGRAIAYRCLARGDQVHVMDSDIAALEELSDELARSHLDIACAASIDATVAGLRERPPFDLVAITAGISAVGRFETIVPVTLSQVVAVNLTGPIMLTTALAQARIFARGGRVVLVSSISHFTGYPGASVYAGTKQGLVCFARSIRNAFRRDYGVTVQVLTPGPMETAHAERYAPPGSKSSRRASPDQVASALLRRSSGGVVVPGALPRVAAIMGTLFPSLTGRIMRRMIYDRL